MITELIILVVVGISVVISYIAVYRGDWVQCNNCETIFYPTVVKALDKKTDTFFSDYAQGWMLKNCINCRGFI